MALLAISVFNTKVNNRAWLTEKTLESVAKTVDLRRHRVVVVDDCSEPETETDAIYERMGKRLEYTLIKLPANLGTAKAINAGWLLRKPGEHCCKLDSDLVCEEPEWLDRLEDCVNRDPKMGVCGLKRIDCWEKPDRTDWFRSELRMLPQTPPQRWLVVEVVNHCLSACALHSSTLLDRVGGLYQMGLRWGLDDSLMSARCSAVGMYSCFWTATLVSHLDPGGTQYHRDKEAAVGSWFPLYHQLVKEYSNGTRDPYCDPREGLPLEPPQ